MSMSNDRIESTDPQANDIAIVGMAAHLPGAANVSQYWANLRDGIESIRQLTEAELLAAGESPDVMRKRNYVRSAAVLDGFEQFDAEFFGFSPKEAAILDPQHRQFLEVAWEALEDAGHPPEGFPGTIGVFAGCGMGSYFYFNICSNPDLVEKTGMFLLRHTGNDKDFLSTRVSHVFDLKGPSISLQTACSTSLVATHYAAQALLNGECDMALAGGVTIELPHGRGYLFNEGEILSPDGHCHAFDHRAHGTVFGSGAGVVVLRRLEDALRDGDHIWAVLKGSAVNNDGAAKAGYLAPSVDGQARAIAEAQAVAGVTADTVSYVECHGTGTFLGDPIEVSALTAAFRETTDATGYCRIGSVKTNIGHLDTAAGVASLIKAALALHHRQMPPSLGYEAPNPAIDFAKSPFTVNDQLTDWAAQSGPRRAGVNSLGVGGTNAHAVLQEAPPLVSDASDWPFQPLVLSARSKAALDQAGTRLAAHLRAHPEQPLADVAFTLKEGRRAFDKRRVLVAETHSEAAELLESGDPRGVFSHDFLGDDPEVVFLFPGGGAQYPGMARDLYETEPVFRDWMDRGLAVLGARLDHDPRALWLPEPGFEAAASEALRRPSVQLPLIMIVEYALAQLMISWGVKPAVLAGHSMGENTAACLAGVIGFDDCIGLVHLRGQLFDTVPAGGMVSVPLSEAELRPYLGDTIDLASVNAPGLCVVSGSDADLLALTGQLTAAGIESQRIQIDIAAHSRMLEPILGRFGDYLRSIRLNAPRIPIISNRSGAPLTDAQATDPDYWVAHLRNTVLFADCMTNLAATPGRVFLEVGPGKALGSLAQANGVGSGQVINAMRHPDQAVGDDVWLMTALSRLWACGVSVDWAPIWGEARRLRVPLPTYPFQRKPYFIAPGAVRPDDTPALPIRSNDLSSWGWQPVWRPRAAECEIDIELGLEAASPQTWLFLADDGGLADACATRLRAVGHRVVSVRAGDGFARLGADSYIVPPEEGRDGYDRLIRDLVARGVVPSRIGHFWLTTANDRFRPGSSFFHRTQEQGFWSLFFLAQAISDENLPTPIHLTLVTNGAAQVRDEPIAHPEKATALGPLRVIPRELPGVTCSQLDVELPQGRRASMLGLTDAVLEELLATPANLTAALRGTRRLELTQRPLPLPTAEVMPIRQGAVCLVTGGFGGIGQAIAADLVRQYGARLVLVTRRALPDRADWPARLRAGDPSDPDLPRILSVQALEALGAEVLVATGDVCNIEDMRQVLAQATARFGAVNVVIHAAGVVDDAPLLAKTPAAVEDVLAPKVHGTQVLAHLFPDGALDLMVLFSSTSTVTAPAGQTDYVAANEYLNAFARSRKGGKTRVVAVNWGIWADVGMAAEAMANRLGTRPPAPRLPAGTPLLDEITFDATGNRLFTASWGVADRWVLDGHRTKAGQALLPGTGYIELAAEALAAQGEAGPFEIRDLYFFRPLEVADGAPRSVRVRLKRSDEGYGFEVRAEAVSGARTGYSLHAQGALALGGIVPPAPLNLAAISARCTENRAQDAGGLRSPQEEHLAFGPRWRVLNRIAYGAGEGLAELSLPAAFRGDLTAGYTLHPALLDLATGWAMGLIAGYQPSHLWVPVSYARVRVHAPLPARVASWVRNAGDNRADGSFARFDITLSDPEGNICIEIEGFSIHKLEAGLAQAARPDDRDMEFDAAAGDGRSLSVAEERLAHNLSQGIRADEGPEAFRRALATGLPQVVVSSLPLPALVAQAGQGALAGPQGQSFERPDLESEYLAPRTDIERTLAGFWQDLLGVGQVGVEDSFFDLGGHSLIAVRLFAMIRKAWSVDFPISVLFEAPTIARCAALIADRVGASGADTPDADTTPARRFTHLVAMHSGQGSDKTPLVVVAGMGGNILNLRHLAHLLGDERPFYGMQARGLFGEHEPHATLADAAADYITELRQVQPHGPYMLGGYSGGGLTAWEMARQLEDAGEKVAMVVLLDTPMPMRPTLTRSDKTLIKIAEFRAKGPGYLLEWARKRVAWELRQYRLRHGGPVAEAETEFNYAALEAAFRAALPLVRLTRREAPAVLFRPPLDHKWKVSRGGWVSAAKEYVYADNEWSQFAPNLQVIEVPGDHDSMVLEPNVRVLAAYLRRCLAEVEPSAEPGQPLSRAAAE